MPHPGVDVRPVVVRYKDGEKSKTGVVRFRCPTCLHTVSSHQKQAGKNRSLLPWFERYILQGLTYTTLSQWKRESIQSLEGKFHTLLTQSPPPLHLPPQNDDESYL